MDDPKRLKPIIKLAEQEKGDAGRLLTDARNQQQTDNRQLGQLQGFYNDYARQFEEAVGVGMNSRQLTDFRTFISNIDDAIARKKREIKHIDHKVEEHRRDWVEKYQRTEALTGLQKQLSEQEKIKTTRRDQKEADDRSKDTKPHTKGR